MIEALIIQWMFTLAVFGTKLGLHYYLHFDVLEARPMGTYEYGVMDKVPNRLEDNYHVWFHILHMIFHISVVIFNLSTYFQTRTIYLVVYEVWKLIIP